MGEPCVYSATEANMQSANTYFAQQMRMITPKAIVFMGANSYTSTYGPSDIVNVAPQGVANLAVDIHYYGKPTESQAQTLLSNYKQAINSIGITVQESL